MMGVVQSMLADYATQAPPGVVDFSGTWGWLFAINFPSYTDLTSCSVGSRVLFKLVRAHPFILGLERSRLATNHLEYAA